MTELEFLYTEQHTHHRTGTVRNINYYKLVNSLKVPVGLVRVKELNEGGKEICLCSKETGFEWRYIVSLDVEKHELEALILRFLA